MKNFVKIIIVAATALLCFILQTSILAHLSFAGITPNLMIVVTAGYAFFLGDRAGMLTGLFCGLLCDIFFGPLIGFEGIVYAVVGYLCGKLGMLLYVEGVGFPIVLVSVSDIVYGLLNFFFLFMLQNRLFFGTFLLHVMIPEIVYTAFAAVILFPVIRSIHEHIVVWEHRDRKKGRRHFFTKQLF